MSSGWSGSLTLGRTEKLPESSWIAMSQERPAEFSSFCGMNRGSGSTPRHPRDRLKIHHHIATEEFFHSNFSRSHQRYSRVRTVQSNSVHIPVQCEVGHFFPYSEQFCLERNNYYLLEFAYRINNRSNAISHGLAPSHLVDTHKQTHTWETHREACGRLLPLSHRNCVGTAVRDAGTQ